MSSRKKPFAVAIMGPTASGKTAAALEIARHIPAEIISVDSALVYRGMDIGTAKPTAEERARVPHHLIDLIDPRDAYSVSQFTEDATRLIHDITARDRLPVLAGGTMMYFKGLQTGLDDLPPANPEIRARLDEEAATQGWPALHDKLARLDPDTAMRLKPNDAQRIQRALEIIEITGQPLSRLHTGRQKTVLPFTLLPIALEPADRSVLHQRIATRFDRMLENDELIDEVRKLQARGDLHLGLPSMRCVGYRQTWQYLEGEFDRKALREKGIAATRQLAKRQLTWLRAMPNRHVIDCLAPDAQKQIVRLVKKNRD
ncbi:tRNA (adenosine(37)-N6)-dimethylallyltransferase MiaA [Oxalobacter sp. OttesenSCG-928-P03]|nr:tRNA (adenosine(37)-N6)-dimethylallyltransferase MiaA [Oxalobacter sp. OttesenSCG-928-P03]